MGVAYHHRLLSPFDQFYRPANTGSHIPKSAASFYLLTPTTPRGSPVEVREPRRLYASETRKSIGSTVDLNSTICEGSDAVQSVSVSTKATTTRSARENKKSTLEIKTRCHRSQVKPPAQKPLPKTKIATQPSSNRHPNGPISGAKAQRHQSTDGNPSIQPDAGLPLEVDATMSNQELEPPRLNAPHRMPFRLGDLLEPDSPPKPTRVEPSSQRDKSPGHPLDKTAKDKASRQDLLAAAEAITLNRGTTDRPQLNSSAIRPSSNKPATPFSAANAPPPPSAAHQTPTQQSTSTLTLQPDPAQTQSTTHAPSQWTPINAPRPPAAQLPSPARTEIRWRAAEPPASANAVGES